MSIVVKKETSRIRKAIEALRPHFRGMSDVDIACKVLTTQTPASATPIKIKAEQVQSFAAKKKRFSTGDVVGHFGVGKGNAAALLAILRIKEVIAPDGKANDNTSRWVFVG